MKLIQNKLQNGATLISIPLKESTSVFVSAWIKAGWRYDPLKRGGLAHFLEHMLLRNTRRFPKANLQSEFIENLGGYGNAYTGLDFTYHWVRIAPNHLMEVINLLADRLQDPLFATREIEKEKASILEEINLNKTNPQRYIWDLFFAHLYQGTPLDRFYSGTPATLSTIKKNDFIKFHKEHYRGDNITFVIAGNFRPEKAKTCLDKILRLKYKSNNSQQEKLAVIKTQPFIRTQLQDSTQETFIMAFRTENINEKERQKLQLLVTLLAGGHGSRIGKIFREQGLVYSWHTYSYQWGDMGYIALQTATEPGKFNKTVNIMLREFLNFSKSNISTPELRRAKEFYKGKVLVDIDSAEKKALWIGEQLSTNFTSVITPEEEVKNIDNLVPEDIIEVAHKYLKKERLVLTAIGPLKAQEIKIK